MTGKNALHYFGRYAVAVFMSFFIVLSVVALFTMSVGDKSGYDVFALNAETGKNEKLYTYMPGDGEDTRYAEYEAQGYELTKSATVTLEPRFRTAAYVVSSVLSLVFTTTILYVSAWNIGNKDINRAETGRVSANRVRGVLAGLLADIPSLLLYLTLLCCKFGLLKPNFLSIFRSLNSHLYGMIYWIYGSATLATDLSAVKLLLLLITVIYLPTVCGIGYAMGNSDKQLLRGLVYKKK